MCVRTRVGVFVPTLRWGLTVRGHPELFFFRVLKHPGDAFDGRPRGAAELLQCLERVHLPKLTTLVSDGWRGTATALRQYRQRHGYAAGDIRHEVVNHAHGEAVNVRGFSTNAIEAQWSAFKRWARKKLGGSLHGSTDRDAWALLLQEFQPRKMLHASKGFPRQSDSNARVNFKDVLSVFERASAMP